MKVPCDWQPSIVSTQIALIGDVAIVAVPGEFTTMAGRRLKNVVKDEMVKTQKFEQPTVVVAGLSNYYTSYVTTYEEYQVNNMFEMRLNRSENKRNFSFNDTRERPQFMAHTR